MCGLEAYADAIVGSLDVEHKKRVTIGVELAAKVRSLNDFIMLCLVDKGPNVAKIITFPGRTHIWS